ncbi:CIA30 family protein [Hyalangium rubrum]|uniref:CIA30 family protein n=1 Tax=Hyalangium rubrum TaxID=3103134 RepID=A0ABU5HJ03_9BACT|nr:CIA30 family protein [Hyalangium sp. s54d21]MDY7233137.1 CIA30 family protein [Hyalangium sp. s54d21]
MPHRLTRSEPARAAIPEIAPGLAQLWFDPSEVTPQVVQALASHVSRTIHRLRRLSSLDFVTPFEVVLDARQLVPVAYPSLALPRIVLPVNPRTLPPGEDLSPEVVHELAHLLLFASSSPFFSEGWAVACSYLLSPSTYFPFSLRDDAPSLHHLLAEQPEGMRTLVQELRPHGAWGDLRIREMPDESNRLAYARAGSFVLHLIEERGVSAFTRLLQALRDDPRLLEEVACERLYGCGLVELEAEWRSRLERMRPAPVSRPRGGSPLFHSSDSDWELCTDGLSQGHVTSLGPSCEDGVALSGRVGIEVALPFISLMRFLRRDRSPMNLRGQAGLRFEARGDGKAYQICLATQRAQQPGAEFIHLLATHPEWTCHEVPFSRFHRFVSDRCGWTGEDVLALYLRVFGYRGQDIHLEIRKLELYS